MSTTQHPLTDETRDRLVSYISGGTIDCSTHEGQYDALSEDDARTIVESLWEPMTQAVQAAALTVALTVALPADPHHDPRPWQDCAREDIREGDLVERPFQGTVRIGVAHHKGQTGDWMTEDGCPLTNGDRWPLRRIPAPTAEKETPVTQTTTPTPAEPLARTLLTVPEGHGAPHHDAKEIKPDDFVLQVDWNGFLRAGKVHYQAEDGDWQAKDGRWIIWAAWRADRPDALTVWPAPTPPAEEVELPSEHPAHLLDVEGWDGERFAYMALDGGGHWCGVDQDGVARAWPLRWIAAFTLPDGTRARRDGDHANGEPRFVKTQEEEK